MGENVGLHEVVAHVGDELADGAQDARRRRHDQPGDLQLARHRRAVHGTGAAEGHQRGEARVVAALHRHDADAAHDVGVRHAQDAGRGGHRVEPERVRDVRLDSGARRGGIEPQCAAEPRLAAEPAEHQVGVGDGRPRAAAAVARRPRHGFRAHGPDAQGAAVVDPGDGAAAGADGDDVDGGQPHGDLPDAGRARRLRAAVADQADVGAGAADVHGDDVVGACQPARHAPRR